MIMSEWNEVLSRVESFATIREDAPLSYNVDFGGNVCGRLGIGDECQNNRQGVSCKNGTKREMM